MVGSLHSASVINQLPADALPLLSLRRHHSCPRTNNGVNVRVSQDGQTSKVNPDSSNNEPDHITLRPWLSLPVISIVRILGHCLQAVKAPFHLPCAIFFRGLPHHRLQIVLWIEIYRWHRRCRRRDTRATLCSRQIPDAKFWPDASQGDDMN